MKLGIMQPYFFPHLNYLDLINYSDKWIVFDTVQYIRKGWMNRNRVLHPNEGWQYVRAPVKKHSRSTPIKDIQISNTDWCNCILAQLQHYKKKAPFFKEVYELMEDCFKDNEETLSRFNTTTLTKICQYLGIEFNYEYFSEMHLPIGLIENPGDWAVRISETLGAREYVNSLGGIDYLAPRFKESKVKLTIRDTPPIEYNPKGYEFISRLSIIDVLMWNSSKQVKEYLDA